MNIWAVANQKDGADKITTTVILGSSLVLRGYKTLLIDLDPHGSLISYFGFNQDTIKKSVYSLFNQEAIKSRIPFALMLCRIGERNLDLLPACTTLITLDKQVSSLAGMSLVIQNALKDYQQYYQ